MSIRSSLRHSTLLALLAVSGAASVAAQTCATERVSEGPGGVDPDGFSYELAVSADGRAVAFASLASNLVPGDTNVKSDVFVRDLASGSLERVSVSSTGAQGELTSSAPALSADGRYAAYVSLSANLVPGDTNDVQDVFLRDRTAGTTELVSVGPHGERLDAHAFRPALSPDGRFVVFDTAASTLVHGDINGENDVYLVDRLTGAVERVSIGSGGVEGDGYSSDARISADGRYVAFHSDATTLVPGDTNGVQDVFLRDRLAGTTRRVSVSSAGAQGNDFSRWAALPADGQVIAFTSKASNLVPGDTNGAIDIFVHELASGLTTRVSLTSGGAQVVGGSSYPGLDASGRRVAFESDSPGLVPGDTNGWPDVFVHDRLTGLTERVSVASDGSQATLGGDSAAISADGALVAFASRAENLAPGDVNGLTDAFVRERGCSVAEVFCAGDGTGGPCPCGNAGAGGAGCAHSAGDGARLEAAGSASAALDELRLAASALPPGATPLLLASDARAAALPFRDGLLCLAAPIARLDPGARRVGGFVWGPGLAARHGWQPGERILLQALFLDPLGPCGAGRNLTNGLAVVLEP